MCKPNFITIGESFQIELLARRRDKVNYKRASLLKNNVSEFHAYIHKQQIFHKNVTICYVMNSYCSLHD